MADPLTLATDEQERIRQSSARFHLRKDEQPSKPAQRCISTAYQPTTRSPTSVS